MNEPRTRLGLFQKARNRPPREILVEIDVDDVRQVRPDWDEQQAIGFLKQHREVIAGQMLEAGMTAVIALARGGEDAN